MENVHICPVTDYGQGQGTVRQADVTNPFQDLGVTVRKSYISFQTTTEYPCETILINTNSR